MDNVEKIVSLLETLITEQQQIIQRLDKIEQRLDMLEQGQAKLEQGLSETNKFIRIIAHQQEKDFALLQIVNIKVDNLYSITALHEQRLNKLRAI